MQPIALNLSFVEGTFILEIVNKTDSPIRIWTARFSSGYNAVRFHVSLADGKVCLIKRKPKRWTVNAPDFFVLGPGDGNTERLDLRDGSWELDECAAGLRQGIVVRSVLDVPADQFATKHHVLTGRYESNSLSFRSLSEIAK